MQSMLNLCATHGVPLCLSGLGITNPLALSKEMADHERRRKAMKKQRSRPRNIKGMVMHAIQPTTNFEAEYGDLDDVILHDLFHTHTHLDRTAKAA